MESEIETVYEEGQINFHHSISVFFYSYFPTECFACDKTQASSNPGSYLYVKFK